MPDRVVDASVLAAFVFKEPQVEEAAEMMTGKGLFSPSLVFYELTHIAKKKSLAHPEKRAIFDQALAECLGMDIRLVEPDHKSVLKLALETGLTSYDACYLYIARILRAPLLTFDERLKTAARE